MSRSPQLVTPLPARPDGAAARDPRSVEARAAALARGCAAAAAMLTPAARTLLAQQSARAVAAEFLRPARGALGPALKVSAAELDEAHALAVHELATQLVPRALPDEGAARAHAVALAEGLLRAFRDVLIAHAVCVGSVRLDAGGWPVEPAAARDMAAALARGVASSARDEALPLTVLRAVLAAAVQAMRAGVDGALWLPGDLRLEASAAGLEASLVEDASAQGECEDLARSGTRVRAPHLGALVEQLEADARRGRR